MNFFNKLQTCPQGQTSYTIKAGDTLYKLAQTYGVTVQSIIAANPGINPNNLQIGQHICIPSTSPSTCPVGKFSYIIKAGDSLYKLAQTYGVTVQSIIDANLGIDLSVLHIGTQICIPQQAPTVCPSGTFSYTIKAGDTLYKLAQTYNVTVQSIIDANPGVNLTILHIGQKICIPQSIPSTCPSGSISYIIKAGDTLYKLAQIYGVTVQSIVDINPGINPNNLQIGQAICIPSTTPPSTCPTNSFSHTIESGDTVYKLAQTYGVTPQSIININPGINPNNLQIGQVICIPNPPSNCPLDSFPYVIKSGDTVYKLAQIYKVTTQSILDLNPGINPNALQIGQIICIPLI